MRNTILVIAIIVFTMIATIVNANPVVLTGESQTKFGTYQLTASSNAVVINDVAYKTWELSYSGCQEKFILFLVPGENGNCSFTVRNSKFEIKYACSDEKFGIDWVDQGLRTLKKNDLKKLIKTGSFESQSVLTTNQKTEEEYLGLIACFMPLLFN
jgi:hypothetical protein